MNYFAATGLFNGFLAVTCGLVIFFQNPRGPKNRIYALFCLSISVFSLFYFLWQLKGADGAFFYTRAAMMGAIFIPVLHYHHTLLMFNQESRARRKLLFVAYGLAAAFSLTNVTPLFISGFRPLLNFPAWPIPGPVFYPFIASFVVMSILSMTLILDFRRHSTSAVLRNEMRWIATATALGYIGGATNFFLFFSLPIPPVLNPAMSIFTLIGALLFFRLGLLDFKVFCRNTTVHIATSLLAGSLFVLILLPFHRSLSSTALILVFSLTCPLIYNRSYSWVQRMINRTTMGRIDHYLTMAQKQMGAIREITYTYESLASNMVNALLSTFPIQMAAVYMEDLQSGKFFLIAQHGMKNELGQDLRYNRSRLALEPGDPLLTHLKLERRILSREAIEHEIRQEKDRGALFASILRIESAVCSPMMVMGNVKGLLVIGEKKENELFHEGDFNVLFSFSRMGEEVMRYIMGMEHEISHTALYSHDMNNDTKSLVQTLQLIQSPLAAKIEPATIQKLLRMAEDVATRLNQTFQMNRDRSTLILKALKGDYPKETIDIARLLRESSHKFMLSAAEKSIQFSQRLPDIPILMNGNGNDLIRVLDNLLANAIRYVEPGGHIDLEAHSREDQIFITVTDDGKGIKQEDLTRIWERGWQAKDARQGASGLGLSIARQIVQVHEGQIQVESDGTHGTRFSIHLPLLSNAPGGGK